MRQFANRLSPAMIVACLALLVALGGTSIAAGKKTVVPAVGVIHVKDVDVPGNGTGGGIATCPAGQRATGGGAYMEGTFSEDDHIIDSEPAVPDKINGFRPLLGGRATTWHVTYSNPNAQSRRLHVYVICTG